MILYMIIFEFFESNTFIFSLKHILLYICYAVSLISLLWKYDLKIIKDKLHSKEAIFVGVVGIVFIAISFFKALSVGEDFNTRSIVQTFLFVIPTLYTFNLINIIETDKIVKLFKITMIIFIAFYFTESSHTILKFFDLNNWANISYSNSNSFTESHICAETFLQLFLAFFYLENYTDLKIKNIKFYTIISLIFTILSFKRLAILFVILLLIFKKIIKYDKNIRFKSNIILALIFVSITYLYIQFITGKLDIGININKFSTNRDYIMSLWESSDYYSYGYGTSLYVIGRYLEMDLVQIFMELGPIALFLFCYSYFRIANRKIYSNLILLYCFFNLLTSSTMPWTSGWIVMTLLLCLISSNKIQNKNEKKKEM